MKSWAWGGAAALSFAALTACKSSEGTGASTGGGQADSDATAGSAMTGGTTAGGTGSGGATTGGTGSGGTGGSGSGGATTGGTGSGGMTTGSTGSGGGMTTGSGSTAAECAMAADSTACGDCCEEEAEPDASAVLIDTITDECACKDAMAACNGDCTAQGANVCNGGTANLACIACIQAELDNPGSECVTAAFTKCTGDPTCLPMLECIGGC